MKLKKGFTLIELLVCFAIIGIISSVVIFNHKAFNDNLEISNLSYQVALALRQAQIYGVSTRDFKEGSPTNTARFSTPYGVHFTRADEGEAPVTSYIFFADNWPIGAPNGKYDGDSDNDCKQDDKHNPEDTCLEKVDIGRGNYVSYLCDQQADGWHCLDSLITPAPVRNKLDITFTRPEPDAKFRFNYGNPPSTVKVCIFSPQDRKREIIVYSTGQISISDSLCPFVPQENLDVIIGV